MFTPDQLKTILQTQFPIDTVSWARATDEVRDLSRHARETLGLDQSHAVDFLSLRSPSEWNQKGIESIVRFYSLMNERQRAQFIADHQCWFDEWTEP